jgi:uncharacterized protein involved in exopolysaccharide biosynthesis
MTPSNVEAPRRDELSLRELVGILWASRLLILSVTLVSAILAGVAAWAMSVKYQATVVLSPVSNSSSSSQLGALGSMASQFGGLASLAGLPVSADSKKAESVAVLQSDALTQRYIAQSNLLPVLYRDKWDAARKTWKDPDVLEQPTLWKANQYFKKRIRTVSTDNKTGLVTMTITWSDPKLAATWANDLVRLTNDFLRNQAIAESERNIAYLNQQAAKTDIVGVRQGIYSILQSEINKVMLARGNEEYALKVVDPAFAPEVPSSLSRAVWVVIGFVLGACAAAALVFARHGFAR